MRLKLISNLISLCAALVTMAGPVGATVVTYTDESTFQAALLGNFTLANLDAAPFGAGPVATHDATFLSLGIDVLTPTAILDSQAFQIPKPGRDRMLVNGTGNGLIGADFTFNFTTPQNGVGVLPNVNNGIGDGGHIRIYSGLDLTGTFLGEADLGVPTGNFGGIISSQSIRSVQITCEFDPDHDCGLYDLQFGATPLPGTLPLFATGLAGLGMIGWLRKRARGSRGYISPNSPPNSAWNDRACCGSAKQYTPNHSSSLKTDRARCGWPICA
jgi:hypothetical protein